MDIEPGDLVFLTKSYDKYFKEKHPHLNIDMVNRLAKLEDIIDWESEKGKKILLARLRSGKWSGLPIKDNRYIFSIYYHDLIGRTKQRGVIERGVAMFSKHPKTSEPFFEKIPLWIYKEIQKSCLKFEVEFENVSGPDDQ